MSKLLGTPQKSPSSSNILSTSQKSFYSESALKSLELQAISLIDSDLTASKQLIEQCLRKMDEQKLPLLENM